MENKGKNRSKKELSTKQRILESSLKLFSQKGYLGATTKEIAAFANITEVTLFRHFSGKEKLFEEVLNTYSFLPELKGLIKKIGNINYESGLELIAKSYLKTLEERKQIMRIMLSELHSYPEKIQKIYTGFIKNIFKMLARFFEEAQKNGIMKINNPEISARAFLGLFFSYFHSKNFLKAKLGRNQSTEAIIKEYVKIFARGTMK